jgi:hypothetical protein
MNVASIWEATIRVLAVAGFVIVSIALLSGITVPWGFFVLLIGMFFGPDVYKHLGPEK